MSREAEKPSQFFVESQSAEVLERIKMGMVLCHQMHSAFLTEWQRCKLRISSLLPAKQVRPSALSYTSVYLMKGNTIQNLWFSSEPIYKPLARGREQILRFLLISSTHNKTTHVFDIEILSKRHHLPRPNTTVFYIIGGVQWAPTYHISKSKHLCCHPFYNFKLL